MKPKKLEYRGFGSDSRYASLNNFNYFKLRDYLLILHMDLQYRISKYIIFLVLFSAVIITVLFSVFCHILLF